MGAVVTQAYFYALSLLAGAADLPAAAKFLERIADLFVHIFAFIPWKLRYFHFFDALASSRFWFMMFACMHGFLVGALIDLSLSVFRALSRTYARKA